MTVIVVMVSIIMKALRGWGRLGLRSEGCGGLCLQVFVGFGLWGFVDWILCWPENIGMKPSSANRNG